MGLFKEFGSEAFRGRVVVAYPSLEPYRWTGKFSSMGDREVGSKTDLVGELAKLSKYPSWSSGGVGVRGGRRMVGCSEAMAALLEVNVNVLISWLKEIDD